MVLIIFLDGELYSTLYVWKLPLFEWVASPYGKHDFILYPEVGSSNLVDPRPYLGFDLMSLSLMQLSILDLVASDDPNVYYFISLADYPYGQEGYCMIFLITFFYTYFTSSANNQSLWTYSLTTNQWEFLSPLPGLQCGTSALFSNLFYHNGSLYAMCGSTFFLFYFTY